MAKKKRKRKRKRKNLGNWVLGISESQTGRNGRIPLRFVFLGLRPSACLGLGLGHPWVTQASRKGHPWATQGPPKGRIEEVSLFATKVEKCRGGAGNFYHGVVTTGRAAASEH